MVSLTVITTGLILCNKRMRQFTSVGPCFVSNVSTLKNKMLQSCYRENGEKNVSVDFESDNKYGYRT
jgi:hypothetical protein